MSDAAAEFWRFSLALYASPDVAPACIVLQDQHGIDVNVALFCCWLGANGHGRLSKAALEAADRAVAPWRHDVVERLREARRAIKAAAVPGSENLYTKAKAVELEAERTLQSILVAYAPAATSAHATAERLADALANLALYVGDAPAEPLRAALRVMAVDDFASGVA
jgi:uncharacterized protein (TIGR02444 family)